MRLTVVSPFLDREHGTELCVIEQIERLAKQDQWTIDLYSQKVSGLNYGDSDAPSTDSSVGILWHKVSGVPGPHLLQYIWWFLANHLCRRRDRRSNSVSPDLVYSPGINCFDADVIVVHIVFHAFYDLARPSLALSRNPLRVWHLLVHRKLYYRLIMAFEQKIYRNPRIRLIAVSSLVASQLKTYFQRDDVTVIPNAVDTARLLQKPETRSEQTRGVRLDMPRTIS